MNNSYLYFIALCAHVKINDKINFEIDKKISIYYIGKRLHFVVYKLKN